MIASVACVSAKTVQNTENSTSHNSAEIAQDIGLTDGTGGYALYLTRLFVISLLF